MSAERNSGVGHQENAKKPASWSERVAEVQDLDINNFRRDVQEKSRQYHQELLSLEGMSAFAEVLQKINELQKRWDDVCWDNKGKIDPSLYAGLKSQGNIFVQLRQTLDSKRKELMAAQAERQGKEPATTPEDKQAGKPKTEAEVKQLVEQYKQEVFGFAKEIVAKGDYDSFIRLIHNILTIRFKREQKQNAGKLKGTIQEIKVGPNGKERFQDGKVTYLPAEGKAIFVGDTHGDSISTQRIIEQSGFLESMARGEKVQLVFLGDYADRGKNDVGNMAMIFKLKDRFPDNVVLMLGNHETMKTDRGQTMESFEEVFPKEMKLKGADGKEGRGLDAKALTYYVSGSACDTMPQMLVTGNGIVATHAGLPVNHEVKGLNTEVARRFGQGLKLTDFNADDAESLRFQLLWNDPSRVGESVTSSRDGHSGSVFGFSKADMESCLAQLGGKVLVRGHEYHPGVGFDGKVLTVFSSGANSPESAYADLAANYAVFDLSKPIDRITEADERKIK